MGRANITKYIKQTIIKNVVTLIILLKECYESSNHSSIQSSMHLVATREIRALPALKANIKSIVNVLARLKRRSPSCTHSPYRNIDENIHYLRSAHKLSAQVFDYL